MIFKGQLSYFIPGSHVAWMLRNAPEEISRQVKIPENSDIKVSGEVLRDAGIHVEDRGFAYSPIVTGGENLKNAIFEIEKTGRKQFEVIKYLGDIEIKREIKLTPKVSGEKSFVSRTSIVPLKKVKDSSKISPEKIKFTVYSGGKIFRIITRNLLPGNKVKFRGRIYDIRANPFKGSKIKYIIFED